MGRRTDHNIRQDDKLFFSGHATSGPINYTINASAGSFHYYCEISSLLGHEWRRQGPSAPIPDSVAGEILVRWADSNTNTGSRFDVRYRVDHRKWKLWKKTRASSRARSGTTTGQ